MAKTALFIPHLRHHRARGERHRRIKILSGFSMHYVRFHLMMARPYENVRILIIFIFMLNFAARRRDASS